MVPRAYIYKETCMPDFIRLANCIVNLSSVREIQFHEDSVVLYWQNGETSALTELDATVLFNTLEKRYGLMTAPAARLWFEEIEYDFVEVQPTA